MLWTAYTHTPYTLTHTRTLSHTHILCTHIPTVTLPQTFTVEVTEDFLEFLETGVLAVEVWGHRRSGFEMNSLAGSEDPEGRRPKSFMER